MAPMCAVSVLQKLPKTAKMTPNDLFVLEMVVTSLHWVAEENWTKQSLSFLNPYWQILENISKNRVVTQRVSWKIFPDFFQNFWFRVMSEELFWKIFPAEFPEYLLRKKVCFLISGHEWGAFLENFSSFILWVSSQEKFLSWVCKPVLSIIDYQILNCFLLHREMHENPTCYTKYLLRLAQGFCTQSMKRPSAPVRVGNRTFSRSRCRSCRDITPYKDTRTTQKCVRCNAGCCTTHSRIICSQCYDS